MSSPINLPPMPTPLEFGYDPKDNSAIMRRAQDKYDEALKLWRQTSLEIAKILAGKAQP